MNAERITIHGYTYIRERKWCPACRGTKYVPTLDAEKLELGLRDTPCGFCDNDGMYTSITRVPECETCDD